MRGTEARWMLGAVFGAYVLAWGSTYIFTAVALRGFEPAALVFLRVLIAAVTLSMLAWWLQPAGQRRQPYVVACRRWPETLRMSLLWFAVPYMLTTLAQEHVPAGLTGVLISSMPLWTAVLAPLLDRDERSSVVQMLAIVVGLVGVALVVGFEVATTGTQLLAAGAILAAGLVFAVGGFAAKRDLLEIPSLGRAAVCLWVAALVLAPLGVPQLGGSQLDVGIVGSLLAVGAFSTAAGAVLPFWIIARVGAARASLAAYGAPVVALTLGAIFLDERITAAAVVGFGLIAVAVAGASRRSVRESDVAPDAAPATR